MVPTPPARPCPPTLLPHLTITTLNSVERRVGGRLESEGGGLKQTLESGKFAFAHTNKLLSH